MNVPLAKTIWTIGHSNRPLDVFLDLLQAHSIELVADVRRFPASRLHPQFNREGLESSLAAAGVGYVHFPAMGGRRGKREKDSPNTGWRVAAFNAYADHMQSAEFQAAFQELTAVAGERRTAIMCAEALPWQCHRRIIADLLIAHGWEVFDIMSAGKARPHALTDFAKITDQTVSYPAASLF